MGPPPTYQSLPEAIVRNGCRFRAMVKAFGGTKRAGIEVAPVEGHSILTCSITKALGRRGYREMLQDPEIDIARLTGDGSRRLAFLVNGSASGAAAAPGGRILHVYAVDIPTGGITGERQEALCETTAPAMYTATMLSVVDGSLKAKGYAQVAPALPWITCPPVSSSPDLIPFALLYPGFFTAQGPLPTPVSTSW